MRALLDHELLTLRQAQRLLHVTRCEINEMITTGKLTTIKTGTHFKIQGWQLKHLIPDIIQNNELQKSNTENCFVNASEYELSMIADWT